MTREAVIVAATRTAVGRSRKGTTRNWRSDEMAASVIQDLMAKAEPLEPGEVDDVIISAGWTISAVEVEDALLRHPEIQEAAVIGVPDGAPIVIRSPHEIDNAPRRCAAPCCTNCLVVGILSVIREHCGGIPLICVINGKLPHQSKTVCGICNAGPHALC